MNNLSLDEIKNITNYLSVGEYKNVNKTMQTICRANAINIIGRNILKWFIGLKTNNMIGNKNSRFYYVHFIPSGDRSGSLLLELSRDNTNVVSLKLSELCLEFEEDSLTSLLSVGITDVEYLDEIAFRYYDKFYISNTFKKNIFSFKNLNSNENIRNFLYSTINITMDFIDPAIGLIEYELNYIASLLIYAYMRDFTDFIFRRTNFIFRRFGWKKAIRSMHLATFK